MDAILPSRPSNPNLRRRSGPGLLLVAAYPFLKALAILMARRGPAPDPRRGILVYQSYQVGDFYMALPAIRLLARHLPVTVIGRPDCLFSLDGAQPGLAASAIGFACPFFADPSPRAFVASLRNAWSLRRRLPRGGAVLDLEADPRTAFFLRVAGLSPLYTYGRRFAWLFDERLPLPPEARHQGAKSEALAEAFLRRLAIDPAGYGPKDVPYVAAPVTPASPANPVTPATPVTSGASGASAVSPARSDARGVLLLSCYTRKDTKNWPFAHWDVLVGDLLATGRSLRILVPPDGDAEFRAFRARWEGRAGFLEGGLPEIQAAAASAQGIIATDNFLGHMAGWLGKPVLWINGSSDPDLVMPRGPRTRAVQFDPMPCRPCGHRCVNPAYKQCLRGLTPEAVAAAARAWLAEAYPG